jgi:hypothetical protein
VCVEHFLCFPAQAVAVSILGHTDGGAAHLDWKEVDFQRSS